MLMRNLLVSMNMWGFYPDFIEKIEEKFHVFLEEKVKENPMKAEFFNSSCCR